MKQGKRKMATMAIVATLLATGATAQTYTHHYPKAVERAAAKWVKQGQWRGAFNKAVPAPTVNLTEFCIQYSRNPKLWDELFQWLQNNDLKALKPGRTPIGKTGLVASVEDGTNWCSEHDLRNGKGSESHRDNIDFMIVVDGVEGLALIDHDTATPSPTTPPTWSITATTPHASSGSRWHPTPSASCSHAIGTSQKLKPENNKSTLRSSWSKCHTKGRERGKAGRMPLM